MIFPGRSGAEEAVPAAAADDVGRARPIDDDAIRALVSRLSRAHRSGGKVIERAAILASGADLGPVMSWIAARAGQPEAIVSASPKRGLHGTRIEAARTQLRYVLPAGELD